MNTALLCLLGFAAWTLLLAAGAVGGSRVVKVLSGRAAPNAFPADVPHGSDTYRRLMRAHANCVENLPVFAVVVLTGAAVGEVGSAFGTMAAAVLGLRIVQSSAHIASGTSPVVMVRATAFFLQAVLLLAMMVTLVGPLRAG